MLVEYIFLPVRQWSAPPAPHMMHAGLTEGEFSLYTAGVDVDLFREVRGGGVQRGTE